jgi:hypothetical protein
MYDRTLCNVNAVLNCFEVMNTAQTDVALSERNDVHVTCLHELQAIILKNTFSVLFEPHQIEAQNNCPFPYLVCVRHHLNIQMNKMYFATPYIILLKDANGTTT